MSKEKEFHKLALQVMETMESFESYDPLVDDESTGPAMAYVDDKLGGNWIHAIDTVQAALMSGSIDHKIQACKIYLAQMERFKEIWNEKPVNDFFDRLKTATKENQNDSIHQEEKQIDLI